MENTVVPLSVTNFPVLKKYENLECHPVENIQNNKFLVEEELRMQGFGNAFGSHMPFKLTMERICTSQSRRLPGLKSSNLGLELAMNRLQKIDYEDFLSTESPFPSREDPHLEMDMIVISVIWDAYIVSKRIGNLYKTI